MVRDPAGIEIASKNSYDYSQSPDLELSIMLPTSGIYEIEVRSWQDQAGGPYVLTLAQIQEPTATPQP